jgi:adenosyl cobinamide kinase/adenosyl cobinamide phosphate guanylyltransferase
MATAALHWVRTLGFVVGRPGGSGSGSQETCLPGIPEVREDVEVDPKDMITLVLGGARSGKSELAERIAGEVGAPVTYVATAVIGDDADLARRVQRHRERRPPGWRTVEAGAALSNRLVGLEGTVLVDSLGSWVAAIPGFEADPNALCRALLERPGQTVVVSEEVGLGVHPSTEVGGRFRDVLGTVNRAVSEIADDAFLVVAGRALRLGLPIGDQTLRRR